MAKANAGAIIQPPDKSMVAGLWDKTFGDTRMTRTDQQTSEQQGDIYQTQNNYFEASGGSSASGWLDPDIAADLMAAADKMDSTISQLADLLGPAFKASDQYAGWSERSAETRAGSREHMSGYHTPETDDQKDADFLLAAAAHKENVADWIRGELRDIEGTAKAGGLPFKGELKERADYIAELASGLENSKNREDSSKYGEMIEAARQLSHLQRRAGRALEDVAGVNYNDAHAKYKKKQAEKLTAPERTRERQEAEISRHKDQKEQEKAGNKKKATNIEADNVNVNSKQAPEVNGGNGGSVGAGGSQGGGKPPKTPGETPPVQPAGDGNGRKTVPPKSEIRHFDSTKELAKFLRDPSVNLGDVAEDIEKNLDKLESTSSDISAIYNKGTLTGISLNAKHRDFGNIKTAQLRYAIGTKDVEGSDQQQYKSQGAIVRTTASQEKLTKLTDKLAADTRATQQEFNSWLRHDALQSTDAQGHNNKRDQLIDALGEKINDQGDRQYGFVDSEGNIRIGRKNAEGKIEHLTSTDLAAVKQNLGVFKEGMTALNRSMRQDFAQNGIDNISQKYNKLSTERGVMRNQLRAMGITDENTKLGNGQTVGEMFAAIDKAQKSYTESQGNVDAQVQAYNELHDAVSRTKEAIKLERQERSASTAIARREVQTQTKLDQAQKALNAENAEKQTTQVEALNKSMQALEQATDPADRVKALADVTKKTRELTTATKAYNSQQERMGALDDKLGKMRSELKGAGVNQPESMKSAVQAMTAFKNSRTQEQRDKNAALVESYMRKAQADVGETVKVAKVANQQETRIGETTKTAQSLLRTATEKFGADNENVQSLAWSLRRMETAGGQSQTQKQIYANRKNALGGLTEASNTVDQMMKQFDQDAAAAEKQYDKLTKNGWFMGLDQKERDKLTAAYGDFKNGKEGMTQRAALDALQAQLRESQQMADNAKASVETGFLQGKLQQQQEKLDKYGTRAGGKDAWTDQGMNDLYKSAEEHMTDAWRQFYEGNLGGARKLMGAAGTDLSRLNTGLKETEKNIETNRRAEEDRQQAQLKATEDQRKAEQKAAADEEKDRAKESQRLGNALNADIGKTQQEYGKLMQSPIFEKLPQNIQDGLARSMERLDTTWSDQALGEMREQLAGAKDAASLIERYEQFTGSDAFKGLSQRQQDSISTAFADYMREQNAETMRNLSGAITGGENAAAQRGAANRKTDTELALNSAWQKMEAFGQKVADKTLTDSQTDQYVKASAFLQEAQHAFDSGDFKGAGDALKHFTTSMGTLTREFNAGERAAKASAAEQEKERAAADRKDTAITKAQDMLTDPRLAAGNPNVTALQNALTGVQTATKEDMPKAMQTLSEAMKPVQSDLRQFDTAAAKAEREYDTLVNGTGVRHQMFNGLTGAQQMAVGDAFTAFKSNRTAANLEALQNAMRTANSLIDLHQVSNKSEYLQNKIGKADDTLKTTRNRAGGVSNWTNAQQDLLTKAQKYRDEAEQARSVGNYEQATKSLANFDATVGRLGTSLKENEQIAAQFDNAEKKAAKDSAKQAADQAREQAKQTAQAETGQKNAERNKYYGDVDQTAKDRLSVASSVYAQTGKVEDLKEYQKALTGVQWREKAAEMKDYNQQIARMRNPTDEMGRDDSTSWANAQQQQMQKILDMQDQFREASRQNDQTRADSILGQMARETSSLQKSLQDTAKLSQAVEKAIGGKNYGRVDQGLKDNLAQAINEMNSAAPEQFQTKLNAVRDALGAINTEMNNISTQDYWNQQSQSLDAYQTKLSNLSTMNGGPVGNKSQWTQSQRDMYNETLGLMTGARNAMNAGDVGTYELLSGKAMGNIDKLNSSLTAMQSLANGAQRPMDGLTRTLMNMAAPMMMWRRFTGYMKKAMSNTAAIDKQMTDLKKVTSNTNGEYQQFLTSTGENAVAIGSSITDLIATTSTFAHMGYSLSDSQKLGVTATKFANVGGFKSTTDAADTMIAAVKGFSDLDIGDADLVADKLTAVANNYAVTVSDISDGLQKSASALNVGGNNIDQSTAMITAIAEVTRDAGAAGSALKVLSMRIRGAKTEIEESGESTEGMAENTSKLREEVKALTNVNGEGGVDIMQDEETFKSTYDIMKEISGVWSKMSDISRSALLEKLAGKVRSNQAAALLENFDNAERALETAQNAEGTMSRVHEKWMDSVEARQAQFKAASETASMTAMPAGTVKDLYQAGTTGMNALNWLMGSFMGRGSGSIGVASSIFSMAAALRSGNGNIWAGLGNMTGVHMGGRGQAEFINAYNQAYVGAVNPDIAGDKMASLAYARTSVNGKMNTYTQNLIQQSNGVVDATKATGGFATAVKNVAKNAAGAVVTFAAVNAGMALFNAGLSWLQENVINRGATLEQEASAAYAKYEESKSKADAIKEEKETVSSQIEELTTKQQAGTITKEETTQLAELQSQIRELEHRAALADRQKQADSEDSIYKWVAQERERTNALYHTANLVGKTASMLSGGEGFKNAEDFFVSFFNTTKEGAMDLYNRYWLGKTEGSPIAQYKADAKDADRRTRAQTEIAQNANTISKADTYNMADMAAKMQAFADLTEEFGSDNLSLYDIAGMYSFALEQYTEIDKQLAGFRSQYGADTVAKAFEGKSWFAEFYENWAKAQLEADSKAYETEEKARQYMGPFLDMVKSGTNSEAVNMQMAATVGSAMMMRGLRAKEGEDADLTKYDFLRGLFGDEFDDAFDSMTKMISEEEDVGKITGALTDKFGLFGQVLGLIGVPLDNLVSMAVKSYQAGQTPDSGGGGAADLRKTSQESVNAIISAQQHGAKIWKDSGFTGNIDTTSKEYTELMEMDDGAYQAAIERANGGLFFNKDKFDTLVRQKYTQELADLKNDVAITQKKYAEAAQKVVDQINKKNKGGDFNVDEYDSAIADMTAEAKRLTQYRNMQAQIYGGMSDYANWLSNKGGAESGDVFDELGEAINAITSGKKSGKTGTREFAAAMQFVTGKSFGEGMSLSDLNTADMTRMAMLSGLDENGKPNQASRHHGLHTIQQEMIEAGILNKDGSVAVAGMTTGEMAEIYNKKYGTHFGEEFFQSVFMGLNDYIEDPSQKYDIGVRDTAEQQEMERAQQAMADAVNEYKNATTKEQQDAALQKVADAGQAYLDSMQKAGLYSEDPETVARTAADMVNGKEKEGPLLNDVLSDLAASIASLVAFLKGEDKQEQPPGEEPEKPTTEPEKTKPETEPAQQPIGGTDKAFTQLAESVVQTGEAVTTETTGGGEGGGQGGGAGQPVVIDVSGMSVTVEGSVHPDPDTVPVEGSVSPADTTIPVEQKTMPVETVTQGVEQGTMPVETVTQGVEQGTMPVETVTQGVEQGTMPVDRVTQGVEQGTMPVATVTQDVEQQTMPVDSVTQGVERGTMPVESTTQGVAKETMPVEQTTQSVAQETMPVAPTTQDVVKATMPVAPTTQMVEQQTMPVAPTTQSVAQETMPVAPTTQDVVKATMPVSPTIQMVEQQTMPVAPTTQDVEKQTMPVAPTTQDVVKGTMPVAPTLQMVEQKTMPVETTTQSVEQQTMPVEKTTQSVEQETMPVEKTTQSVEQATMPVETTTQLVAQETMPVEQVVLPVETTALKHETPTLDVEPETLGLDTDKITVIPKTLPAEMAEGGAGGGGAGGGTGGGGISSSGVKGEGHDRYEPENYKVPDSVTSSSAGVESDFDRLAVWEAEIAKYEAELAAENPPQGYNIPRALLDRAKENRAAALGEQYSSDLTFEQLDAAIEDLDQLIGSGSATEMDKYNLSSLMMQRTLKEIEYLQKNGKMYYGSSEGAAGGNGATAEPPKQTEQPTANQSTGEPPLGTKVQGYEPIDPIQELASAVASLLTPEVADVTTGSAEENRPEEQEPAPYENVDNTDAVQDLTDAVKDDTVATSDNTASTADTESLRKQLRDLNSEVDQWDTIPETGEPGAHTQTDAQIDKLNDIFDLTSPDADADAETLEKQLETAKKLFEELKQETSGEGGGGASSAPPAQEAQTPAAQLAEGIGRANGMLDEIMAKGGMPSVKDYNTLDYLKQKLESGAEITEDDINSMAGVLYGFSAKQQQQAGSRSLIQQMFDLWRLGETAVKAATGSSGGAQATGQAGAATSTPAASATPAPTATPAPGMTAQEAEAQRKQAAIERAKANLEQTRWYRPHSGYHGNFQETFDQLSSALAGDTGSLTADEINAMNSQLLSDYSSAMPDMRTDLMIGLEAFARIFPVAYREYMQAWAKDSPNNATAQAGLAWYNLNDALNSGASLETLASLSTEFDKAYESALRDRVSTIMRASPLSEEEQVALRGLFDQLDNTPFGSAEHMAAWYDLKTMYHELAGKWGEGALPLPPNLAMRMAAAGASDVSPFAKPSNDITQAANNLLDASKELVKTDEKGNIDTTDQLSNAWMGLNNAVQGGAGQDVLQGLMQSLQSLYDSAMQQEGITIPTEIEQPESIEVPEPDPVTVPVNADTSSAQGAISSLGGSVTVSVDADTSSAEETIKGLGGGGSDTIKISKAAAEGTENAVSAPYLVDEAGAELIEHRSRGTYELGTDMGARFTKLDAGDIVHNAKDTKKILRRGIAMRNGGVATGEARVNTTTKWTFGAKTTGNPVGSGKTVGDSSSYEKDKQKAQQDAAAEAANAQAAFDLVDHMAIAMLKWIKKILDWIPTYLNVLKKKTTEFVGAAEDAVHYLSQNQLLDSAIGNIAVEIQANVAAVARYRSFLRDLATKSGFSDDMVALIQKGAIDITEFSDENTVKSIQTYQQYWEKLVACKDALATLNDQMEALSKQKLDNIVGYFDRIDGLLQDQQKRFESLIDLKKQYGQELKSEDYTGSLSTMEQKLTNALEEQAALISELEQQLGVGGDVVQAILDGGKAAWDAIAVHVKKGVDEGIEDLQEAIDDNIYVQTGTYAVGRMQVPEVSTATTADELAATPVESKFLFSQGSAYNGYLNLSNIPDTHRAAAVQQAAAAAINNLQYDNPLTQQMQDSIAENMEMRAGHLPDVEISTVEIPVEPASDEDIAAIADMLGLNISDGTEEALRNLETIKSLFTTTWDNPLAIGSETWYSYMSTLESLQESINSTKIEISEMNDEIANIPLTNLKTGYDYLEEIRKNLEGVNSLLDAQGAEKYPETYRSLISVGMRQIENLEEQNKLIEEQMSALDPLSEKYQELRDDLRGNLDTIADIRENQEEWNDAIIDLQIDRLKKQNDSYKEQLRLMQALDDLEKAKQRRLLIYHDEGGFRYEADEDALEAAQEAANDAVFDSLVSSLEKSKETSNIYGPLGERLIQGSSIIDSLGNTLVPVEDKLSGLNFEPYYQSILNGAEQSGLLASMLSTIDMAKVLEQAIGGDVNIDISGMTLNGVNDAEELGNAIINQLPNYLLQALYKKGA